MNNDFIQHGGKRFAVSPASTPGSGTTSRSTTCWLHARCARGYGACALCTPLLVAHAARRWCPHVGGPTAGLGIFFPESEDENAHGSTSAGSSTSNGGDGASDVAPRPPPRPPSRAAGAARAWPLHSPSLSLPHPTSRNGIAYRPDPPPAWLAPPSRRHVPAVTPRVVSPAVSAPLRVGAAGARAAQPHSPLSRPRAHQPKAPAPAPPRTRTRTSAPWLSPRTPAATTTRRRPAHHPLPPIQARGREPSAFPRPILRDPTCPRKVAGLSGRRVRFGKPVVLA